MTDHLTTDDLRKLRDDIPASWELKKHGQMGDLQMWWLADNVSLMGDEQTARAIALLPTILQRLIDTEEALAKAREAIASLPEDALGMGACVVDFYDGREEPYPIRDELLAEIDAALAPTRTEGSSNG